MTDRAVGIVVLDLLALGVEHGEVVPAHRRHLPVGRTAVGVAGLEHVRDLVRVGVPAVGLEHERALAARLLLHRVAVVVVAEDELDDDVRAVDGAGGGRAVLDVVDAHLVGDPVPEREHAARDRPLDLDLRLRVADGHDDVRRTRASLRVRDGQDRGEVALLGVGVRRVQFSRRGAVTERPLVGDRAALRVRSADARELHRERPRARQRAWRWPWPPGSPGRPRSRSG